MKLAVIVIASLAAIVSAGGIYAALAAPLSQDCGSVAITSPVPGSDLVRGRVIITGSASIADFQFYKVEFAAGTNPADTSFHNVAPDVRRTAVRSGRLDVWDTTGIPDGPYTLRLTVVDIRGNYPCVVNIRPVVVGNRLPTATATATPTETLSGTRQPATATATLAAPTVALPTSPALGSITSTSIVTDTTDARSLLDPGFLTGIGRTLFFGACGMGGVISVIGLLALLRWVVDQI